MILNGLLRFTSQHSDELPHLVSNEDSEILLRLVSEVQQEINAKGKKFKVEAMPR